MVTSSATIQTQIFIFVCTACLVNFNPVRPRVLSRKPLAFDYLVVKASLLATCENDQIRNGAEAVRLATLAYESKSVSHLEKWRAVMVLAEAYAEIQRYDEARMLARYAIELLGPDSIHRASYLRKLARFEMNGRSR